MMVESPSGTSVFGDRIIMGLRRLSIEPPLLLSVLRRVLTWAPSLLLVYGPLLIRGALILVVIAYCGIGNYDLTSGITPCNNINLPLLYLAPSELDTTYDL